jgi:hypothetical protein
MPTSPLVAGRLELGDEHLSRGLPQTTMWGAAAQVRSQFTHQEAGSKVQPRLALWTLPGRRITAAAVFHLLYTRIFTKPDKCNREIRDKAARPWCCPSDSCRFYF